MKRKLLLALLLAVVVLWLLSCESTPVKDPTETSETAYRRGELSTEAPAPQSTAGQGTTVPTTSLFLTTSADTGAPATAPTTGTEGAVTTPLTPSITEPPVTYEDIVYNTEPVVQEPGEPLRVNWNPYLVSPLIEQAGEEYKRGMQDMIHAILNHRPTVSFSTSAVMMAVCDNLFLEFPPAALVTVTPDTATYTVRIDYRLERGAHLEAIAAFKAALEKVYADTLLAGDSEAVKALLLYHFVSSQVDYFSRDYQTWQTNAFYALTEGESICYGFSDLYNYLLRQVGIEAYLVKGYRSADKAAHGWSLVKIDGDWYHCDATWESSAYDGAGFMYFGLTDAERAEVLSLSSATVGDGTLARALPVSARDDRFDEINGDRIFRFTWELDRESETICFTLSVLGLPLTYSFAK